MQHPVVIDLAPLLHGPGGIGTRRFHAQIPRVQDAARAIADAERRWPHRESAASVDAAALAVLQRARRLRLAGPAASIGAIEAVVRGLAPDAALSVQAGPATRVLANGEALVCLEGPAWVDAAAETAVREGGRVVVAGAGQHPAPPRGAWISDHTAGDARACWLGSTMATLLAWAGADADAWTAGLTAGQGRCALPALYDNPGSSLAAALDAVPDAVPVLLATTPELTGFVRAVNRLWSSQVRGQPAGAPLAARTGMLGIDGLAGDELLFDAVHGGPRDRLVVLWGPRTPDAAVWETWLAREGRPHLWARSAGVDARTLGQLAAVALHAGVGLAALRGLDPLGPAAARAWTDAEARTHGDTP